MKVYLHGRQIKVQLGLQLSFQFRKLREQHDDELQRLSSDLLDEQSSKNNVDKRLADLRVEVSYIADILLYLLTCPGFIVVKSLAAFWC